MINTFDNPLYNKPSLAEDEELMHYGTPRHSGRYPWGSGDKWRNASPSVFSDTVDTLKKEGYSQTEISKLLGFTTTEYRAIVSRNSEQQRVANIKRAQDLSAHGYSNVKIAEMMGVTEGSVRNLLKKNADEVRDKNVATANAIKKAIDKQKYVDVGKGVEIDLNVSEQTLKNATKLMENEGYKMYYIKQEQATNKGQYTTVKVMAKEDTPYSEIYQNSDKIAPPNAVVSKTNNTVYGIEPPASLDGKRVYIRYAEDGGVDRDGTIELRRGVEDISLGNANYAQVRVAVDGTSYLKGMAHYSSDIPKGYDVVFNTNKPKGTPPEKVFKPLKDDPDNPFGAEIKANGQRHYIDADGKEKLSVINKVNEEGDWDTWSRTLSSQMLSKQDTSLIKRQLDLTFAEKMAEYENIDAIENPTIRAHFLSSFADECDSAAVDLKAKGLPGQAQKVILPVTSLKETEIYAPTYENGTKLALVRYPHAGTFEIPIVTVNNKNKKAKDILGNARDAVGINAKVAERLSGADFDGDTVVCLPTGKNGVHVKSTPALKGLKNFDPKKSYPAYEGMEVISPQRKQTEMGKVSNLITDMTLRGAKPDELARAVRHSMVVIDSEKHKLNWKQSEIDNGIAELKEKYQGKANAGASTLISRASSTAYVNEREDGAWVTTPTGGKKRVYIDEDTGAKLYNYTGRTYKNKAGKEVVAQQKSTKMYEVGDARELSSGTKKEELYANYANNLKSLANWVRKDLLVTPNMQKDKDAAEYFSDEVKSLNAKLKVAEANAPKERQAQLIAGAVIKAKKAANPDMTDGDLKKVRSQAIKAARDRVGASGKNTRIVLTDSEYEALSFGALSHAATVKILAKVDQDTLKAHVFPKNDGALPKSTQSRIKSMSRNKYTIAEIAAALGVSTSTVSKYL